MTQVSQSQFREAVFDPQSDRPDHLTDGAGRPAGKRFDVYRNNVIVSLKAAMTDAFPAINALIGDANFDALTSQFVRLHPPEDPRMAHYGRAFPEVLTQVQPLAHMPYLADVARLELALRSSYHAADHVAVTPETIAEIAPETLADQRFAIAPSARILRSEHPVLDIWTFARFPGSDKPRATPQTVLISRSEFDPEPHAIPSEGADFIENLSRGTTLGQAINALPDAFDFAPFWGHLLRERTLCPFPTT